MCPDGRVASLDQYEDCNFGRVPNDIVMTSSMKDDATVKKYKNMLHQAVRWFGHQGTHTSNPYNFTMFTSGNIVENGEKFTQRNVLFNDATRNLTDVGTRDRYYTWIGKVVEETKENCVIMSFCLISLFYVFHIVLKT